METKTSISKPSNISTFFTEGILSDEKRFSVMNFLRPRITEDVLDVHAEKKLHIDIVVVNGLWSLLRSVITCVVHGITPDKSQDDGDRLNIELLMDIIKENDFLFHWLILKDEFLKAQYTKASRILYEEDVICRPKFTRCLITGEPLPKLTRADKITINAKILYVSRSAFWKRSGFRSLTTLELFQLFFSSKQIQKTTEEFVRKLIESLNIPMDSSSPSVIANRLSSSEEISIFIVKLMLEFEMMNDLFQHVIKS